MKWKFEELKVYLQNLQQLRKLPHNLLLISEDSTICEQILRHLQPDFSSLNSFFFPFKADFQTQKTQLTDLLLWTKLARPKNKYGFFCFEKLEQYSLPFYNRLLKLLEDHSSNIVGILQTKQRAHLPNTLVSRCQIFKVLPPSLNNQFASFPAISPFFTLLRQKTATWQDFFPLFPSTAEKVFWPWFQTLLIAWKTNLIASNSHFLLPGFIYGWKLLLTNLRTEQKYHFTLDSKTNWILFLMKLETVLQVKRTNR